MKAWQLSSYGEPEEVLELADRPRPVPGQGQLLVRVLAASANFPDFLMIRGNYQVKPPLPFVPGVELCGEVVEAGPDVTGFAPGDRVLGGAALPDGAFAEYALMDAVRALPVPESLDDAEAAPFHVTYQTGWFGLHRRARLAAGETLLVHAAAGGVGSGAVQLGKAAGATVIGVTGGKEKAAIARELGADVVIDRHEEDFVQVVKDVTGGRGADVVYDPVGGDDFDTALRSTNWGGRLIVIGFAGGKVQQIPANILLVKNLSALGFYWGSYRRHRPQLLAPAFAQMFQWWESGKLKPRISGRYDLAEAKTALRLVGERKATGKIVLTTGAQ